MLFDSLIFLFAILIYSLILLNVFPATLGPLSHKARIGFSQFLPFFILLLLFIAWAQSYATQKLKLWRRELAYLLCAVGGGVAIVSIIKSVNHVSCAWDFSRYGGKTEYATVFTEILHGHGADCFPAGHASGGYAWVALYLLGVHLQSRWRWAGLAFAFSVGLIFGLSQQLRGAHFISHDLWTLGICWFFSLLVYKLMLANYKIKD